MSQPKARRRRRVRHRRMLERYFYWWWRFGRYIQGIHVLTRQQVLDKYGRFEK